MSTFHHIGIHIGEVCSWILQAVSNHEECNHDILLPQYFHRSLSKFRLAVINTECERIGS